MTDAAQSPPLLTIAIDGPAGAGKSTVARQVAHALGYTYIDTGAMYRAVAWAVLEGGINPEDIEAVGALASRLEIALRPGADGAAVEVLADGQNITPLIRTPAISNLTSPLSAIPAVRRRLVALQRAMGAGGGVVMEGRDIGTVVLPDAEVKVFLTASLHERARRRLAEFAERGVAMSYDQLERDIAARDARDGSRDIAPMAPAPDAVVLDSGDLTEEEVVAAILTLCRAAQGE